MKTIVEIQRILDSFKEIRDQQDFPYEAMREAVAQKDAITLHLLDVLDYIYENAGKFEEDDDPYALHIYAAFLLSQFREKRAFSKLVRLLTLENSVVDFLFGDSVTEDYPNFLISTYDGNLQALHDILENETLNAFVRSTALDVCQWLFQNGQLTQADFVAYLHRLTQNFVNDEDGIIGANIASVVVDCHFTELLDDIRRLYDEERADPMHLGKFDCVLDYLFTYEPESYDNRRPVEDASVEMSQWSCYKQEKSSVSKSTLKQAMRTRKKVLQREEKGKIGRNDSCPCGSGKKYKNCCLGKELSPEDAAAMWKRSLLKEYPLLTDVPEGHVRFTDFFDARAIEVDKSVYMALHHRIGMNWEQRNDIKDRREKIGFLKDGYRKFLTLCKDEGIASFQQYDKKHQVHYSSASWMKKLADLLDEFQEQFSLNNTYEPLRDEVGQTIRVMG
jgi:hypothetical protein